jgi:tetratricopeptide (TPR) repeat protein
MSIKDRLKIFLQEAVTYKNQGLLDESRIKYCKALEILKVNQRLGDQKTLIQIIESKMTSSELNTELESTEAEVTEQPYEVQELIKTMILSSIKNDSEKLSFEDAITLSKLGQYDIALEALKVLVEKDLNSFVAAKNILTCHISQQAYQAAIDQLIEWTETNCFSSDQLSSLRAELKDQLSKQGVKIKLPKLLSQNFSTINQTEFIDIISIEIPLKTGKGKNQTLELDVDFQANNMLSLIIPRKDKSCIDDLKDGLSLKDITYYSPFAILKGPGKVNSLVEIQNGPKKGDYCLKIKI